METITRINSFESPESYLETLQTARQEFWQAHKQNPHEAMEREYADWRWHTGQTLDSLNPSHNKLILELVSGYYSQENFAELQQYLESTGTSMATYPMNFLLGKNGLLHSLPTQTWRINESNPYGLLNDTSAITKTIDGKRYSIAARHPGYDTYLADLTTHCDAGCPGCYKGEQVRRGESKFEFVRGEKTEIILHNLNPVQKIRELVQVWNTTDNPPSDILLSGGEPLSLPNNQLREILKMLVDCKPCKTIRFCTGMMFLGMPFRFYDSELLDILKETSDQKPLMLNCNIFRPENISREAKLAIDLMRERGINFEILPQIPIIQGVNWDINNLDKSLNFMAKFCKCIREQINTQAYKLILDMQGSVPIIHGLVLAAQFRIHQGSSNIIIPTAVECFSSEGRNIDLHYSTCAYLKGKIEIVEKGEDYIKIEYDIPYGNTDQLIAGYHHVIEKIPKSSLDNPFIREMLNLSI
jgi:4Fe-4S single cluster domain